MGSGTLRIAMDYQVLFNICASIVAVLIGWFVRIAYDATLKMSNDLVELERHLHMNYLRKEDYKDDIRDIKNMLAHITSQMEKKADK